jgi:hypothetical protein
MVWVTESKLLFLHLERNRKIITSDVDISTNLKPIPIIFCCFLGRHNYTIFKRAVKAFGRIPVQKTVLKMKKASSLTWKLALFTYAVLG